MSRRPPVPRGVWVSACPPSRPLSFGAGPVAPWPAEGTRTHFKPGGSACKDGGMSARPRLGLTALIASPAPWRGYSVLYPPRSAIRPKRNQRPKLSRPNLSSAPAAPVSLCHGREKRDELGRPDARQRRPDGGDARRQREAGLRYGEPAHPDRADQAARRPRPDGASDARNPGPEASGAGRDRGQRPSDPGLGHEGPGRRQGSQRKRRRRPRGAGNG